MKDFLGFFENSSGEYVGIDRIHLDCFKWVKRGY
jgi:hypothetical protein